MLWFWRIRRRFPVSELARVAPKTQTPVNESALNSRMRLLFWAEKKVGSASCCTSYDRPTKSLGIRGPVASVGMQRATRTLLFAHSIVIRCERGCGGHRNPRLLRPFSQGWPSYDIDGVTSYTSVSACRKLKIAWPLPRKCMRCINLQSTNINQRNTGTRRPTMLISLGTDALFYCAFGLRAK